MIGELNILTPPKQRLKTSGGAEVVGEGDVVLGYGFDEVAFGLVPLEAGGQVVGKRAHRGGVTVGDHTEILLGLGQGVFRTGNQRAAVTQVCLGLTGLHGDITPVGVVGFGDDLGAGHAHLLTGSLLPYLGHFLAGHDPATGIKRLGKLDSGHVCTLHYQIHTAHALVRGDVYSGTAGIHGREKGGCGHLTIKPGLKHLILSLADVLAALKGHLPASFLVKGQGSLRGGGDTERKGQCQSEHIHR